MKNLLLSAAIGDIAGSVYEGRSKRTKDYSKVKIFAHGTHFTDDTVLTFACAEAFIRNIDMSWNLWKCANEHRHAGFGSSFKAWFHSHDPQPYGSKGDGSAMRCSSAGWLAKTEKECIDMAKATAVPTHNSPEGISGAVATALCIFHLKNGKGKDFIKKEILEVYYPKWANMTYKELHDTYECHFTCPNTVGPAIICFLESKDYVDCLKLAISLGGDADTLAAIAGPMAYAYYQEIPESLINKAFSMLPEWMQNVNRQFDEMCNL